MKAEVLSIQGTEVVAFQRDKQVFVFVRPICSALGLDFEWQSKKIKSDPVLSEFLSEEYLMDKTGRQQMSLVLPMHLIHGWLFSIEADRVDVKARESLIAFQRECYQVLFDHFYGKYHEVKNNHVLILELKKQWKECQEAIRYNKAKSKTIEKQIEELMKNNCHQLHINWEEFSDEVKELN